MTNLEVYRKATKMMGRPKFSDLMDEVREFWEEPSWEKSRLVTVCGCVDRWHTG